MNFLQLCQRLRLECVGVSGAGPASVTGQTGDMARLVNWIASAYEDIQNLHANWRFMRVDSRFQTVTAKQEYTPTEAGASNVRRWLTESLRVYPSATGVAGEVGMSADEDWGRFRDSYLFGALRQTSGQPVTCGVMPDKGLSLWPVPDGAYTLEHSYMRRPHVMVDGTDEPIFDEGYHMVIVWRALIFYAGHAAAPEAHAVGQVEHKRTLASMAATELPRFGW